MLSSSTAIRASRSTTCKVTSWLLIDWVSTTPRALDLIQGLVEQVDRDSHPQIGTGVVTLDSGGFAARIDATLPRR